MHVLYRFDTGGLENGVVNLINHMPTDAYRHMVVALTEVTDFRHRLQRADVPCVALHKPAGHGFKAYRPLWRLLRQHRPAVVHTRNLAALEMQLPAWAARVPVRIHGEHGRDLDDLDGHNVGQQRVRRLYSPFVDHYVALSQDLQSYLVGRVGIQAHRIAHICNGVDADRFTPAVGQRVPLADSPFPDPSLCVFGTVGRMAGVKDQTLLARAFVRAMQRTPDLVRSTRLVMVGEGPLRAQAQAILDEAGFTSLAWLPGERPDVADVMRSLDCFVLPSLAEGISNTILEAMATGLPVIATQVGGNGELVSSDRTGCLVPSANVDTMAEAITRLALDRTKAAEMGRAARADVEQRFSLHAMVGAYQRLYDAQLAKAGYRTRDG